MKITSSMWIDIPRLHNHRYRIISAIIFVVSLGAGARPKGMPMHRYFLYSHMNCMYTYRRANGEVYVEVGKVHFCDYIIAAKKLLNGVWPLHRKCSD